MTQVSITHSTFGSSSQGVIESHAAVAHQMPVAMPADRNTQPMSVAFRFISSSMPSAGSRENTRPTRR